jgi:hypothetical protein
MAHTVDNTSMFGPEQRLTGAYLVIALLALFVGVVTGLFQALSHAGLNLYPHLMPVVTSYLPRTHVTRGDECPGVDHVFYLWLPPVHCHARSGEAIGEPRAGVGDLGPTGGNL